MTTAAEVKWNEEDFRTLEKENEKLQDRIGALTQERVSLLVENSDLRDEIDQFQGRDIEEMAACVNALLDEVERPVGKLNFTVPLSSAVDRAIVALYDAVGRNI